MKQPAINGQVVSAPQKVTAEIDDYRYITDRITRLQERITTERRNIEWLEGTLAGAKAASFQNEDDIADMTQRLGHLKNTVAQHLSELDFFMARLDLLQKDQKSRPK
jgi:uncharacterized coiled-coil protein SlyX